MVSENNDIDYAGLAHSLKELRALTDAAEAHGLICGFVCAGKLAEDTEWVSAIVGDVEEEDPLDLEAGRVLVQVYARTRLQLEGFQFDFQLMLPSDTAPLSDRVAAMTRWCQGLLTGLVLGGAPVQASDEVQGVIEECTQLAMAEPPLEESEQDEQALFDITEHLRLSTIFLHSIFNESFQQTTLH
jgi:uncharacterized protein YgfB (UPF0149 family)